MRKSFLTTLMAASVMLSTAPAWAGDPLPAAPAVEAGRGEPITLNGARQAVRHWLDESGQRLLRPGTSEFDRNGNVAVEVVSIQGTPVYHLLVDGRTGQLSDQRSGKILATTNS